MSVTTLNLKLAPTPLSGSWRGMTFRYVNGKQIVRIKPEPKLPLHPTRAQIAQYKKRLIVDDIVARVQQEMNDLYEELAQYHNIHIRVSRIYDKLSPYHKKGGSLTEAIIAEYCTRFMPENKSKKLEKCLSVEEQLGLTT
ncbi:MAG: hypothetical protein J5612_00385 [Paludibacteraceae bacterium]|nr:hypothetical protein [Paludibacteraceae bacterium]